MIRVTSEADGEILNRGYAYWAQAWMGGAWIITFVGHTDGQVHFYQTDGQTVTPLGPLLPYGGTGEGWYFDASGWIYLCDGPRLRRVHPFSGADQVVFDYGNGSYRLWQAHSSESGQVHSATVQKITSEGPYQNIGTVVARPARLTFYPAQGTLDESQVDASGEFLVIKENDDNRIVTLATGEERIITDAEGALGHSDLGSGFAVGEDNQQGQAVRIDLTTLERTPLFSTWNLGHVAVRGQRFLFSDPQRLLVWDDDTGARREFPHGMTGDGYDHQVHANLSPDGSVVAYVSNHGSPRFDLYLEVL